ncbi:hypothetical protein EW145_g4274 [Phellinidium pouzarii]|uniref:ABC transporter domain-containing protein n=1 Tax=Phellinidium pouzarii TaxID=167371 RepID=A0A4S4L4C3_9AGAM|nr:hypothetical protein EW145_g4274 [Phellinidium pouzarii]
MMFGLAKNNHISLRELQVSRANYAYCYSRHITLSRARLFARKSESDSNLNTIINIPRANVYRFGDGNMATPIFKDLEWTVKDGESWAIVGPAGSEKTHLLDMLLGYMRVSPAPNGGIYPFLGLTDPPQNPLQCIARVSFIAQRRAAGGAFYDYTARYGAVREDDRLTLREVLFAELKNEDSRAEFDVLAEKLELKHLLDLPFIVLSNGQTRRASIAKALLSKPELLLLDEPLTGLDINHRPKLIGLLHELHETRKPRVLMALRPQDPLPEWITHVALVEGQYVRTQTRASAMPLLEQRAAPKTAPVEAQRTDGDELVSMKDVNVGYHERHVLKNINWTIKEGERWHLHGSNGSGKTTLLSLLTGDHPQSYTQRHLVLFEKPRRRQPTASLQRLVGCASPEVAAAFPRRLGARALSVRDAIATGFEGTFAYRPRTPEMECRVDELLAHLGPARWSVVGSDGNGEKLTADFGARAFAELAPGEQSIVLLMRALVNEAPLLVLDEVFAGMDSRMIAAATDYLRNELDSKQAVVFVTHWEEEVPWYGQTMRKIRLEDGQATIQ